jgi:dTDP-6-deoxy-L-talose 4-dehydrogenase (NAD+)
MKVLVTGATGFIGDYVVNELLKNNHSVVATSRHIEKAKEFSWFNNVKYIHLDISELKNNFNYFKYFDSPQIVIHLAWEGLPNYRSLSHIEHNLFTHYSFLKNLIINGATDISVSGTCLEYGLQEGKLNEAMPAKPENSYSIAKDSLRKFLEQLQHEVSFDLKWIRLFYMYGKGQKPNSILSLLETALKNGDTEFKMSPGDQQRDYLPVEKVAEYIVKIALQKKVSGIINCCSGVPVTINQLVENCLHEKSQNINLIKGFYSYPDYEPRNFWGDNSKLQSLINN